MIKTGRKGKITTNESIAGKEDSLKGSIPLPLLKSGERGNIVKINTDNIIKLRKLTAFGIMPGFDVAVIQKYPAIVIQIGYTQVALDNDIASEIIVEKLE